MSLEFLRQIHDNNKRYEDLSESEKQCYEEYINQCKTKKPYLFRMIDKELFFDKDTELLKNLLLDHTIEFGFVFNLLKDKVKREKLHISEQESKNYIIESFNQDCLEPILFFHELFTEEQIIKKCIKYPHFADAINEEKRIPLSLKKHILDVLPIDKLVSSFPRFVSGYELNELSNYLLNLILQKCTNFAEIAALVPWLAPNELALFYDKLHLECLRTATLSNFHLFMIFIDFLSQDEKRRLTNMIVADIYNMPYDILYTVIHCENFAPDEIPVQIKARFALYSLSE